MALIILLIGLLVLGFCAWKTSKTSLFSPTLIVSLAFLFSSTICFFNRKDWNLEFSLLTTLLIFLFVFCIYLGESIVSSLFGKRSYYFCKRKRVSFDFPRPFVFACFAFVLFSTLYYYSQVRNLSSTYFGNTSNVIENMKNTIYLDNVQVGGTNGAISYLSQMCFTASGVIVEMEIFYLVYHLASQKELDKNPLIYFTIVLYIVMYLLTGRRSGLLNLFIFALCSLFYFIERKRIKRLRKKVLVSVFPTIVLVIVLFNFAGMLTGKTTGISDLPMTVSIYGGSSIYNFNDFVVNQSSYLPSSSFGMYTLSGISSLFRKLGFDIPQNVVALEYHVLNGGYANTYTAFRRYVSDFGIFGCSIICMGFGVLYSVLFKRLFTGEMFALSKMLILHCLFPLFFMSIEERFFMDIFLTRTLYEFIYFFIFYHIIFKQRKIHIVYCKNIYLRKVTY